MLPHEQRDTICALASGALPAAVAIIRVSGPKAGGWARQHVPATNLQPRKAALARIIDGAGNEIDEGLVLWMPGPGSFTGEDVLELQLHGGSGVVEHALDTLTKTPGIRLAEPGEFTRRAFEAGRLDLTQAEGIADLVEAETRAQKDQALRQTHGALGELYSGWRSGLTKCLALLDVSIDFPDESEAPETVTEPVRRELDVLIDEFDQALKDGEIDQRIRDGFRVAILGEPNVGKSTLLNYLARREAAIVTDVPGTTRDIVEVRTRLGGLVIWFQDTAGIRDTADSIEQEGVRRAARAAAEADLRIFLLDHNPLPSPLLAHIREGDLTVRTKRDLDDHVNPPLTPGMPAISAKTGAGCEALTDAIVAELRSRIGTREAPVLTRARHRRAIERAREEALGAVAILDSDAGAELTAEHIRLAARALAGLVGEVDVEEVLGEIFSGFCLGK